MMDKRILVIDDEDQLDDLKELETLAGRNGINLTCMQFNVGSPNEPGLLTNNMIDIEKVKNAYKERFKGIEFNMVVCDWGLSDDFIDGAELMRRMVPDCFSVKTPRILYSGLLKEKIEEKLDSYDKTIDATKEPVIKYITSLIRSNYLAFEKREHLKSTILGHLKDSEDLDFILLDTLNSYPDHILTVGHGHKLEGKSFSEVARLIKAGDEVAYDFKKDIIQEVILYLTEKQAKEKK